MENRNGNRLFSGIMAFLLLLAAVACWRLGLGAAEQAAHSGGATLRLEQAFLAADYAALETAERDAANPVSFTLWTQMENRGITTPGAGKKATTSAVYLRGDSRAVFPIPARLALGDADGCLLDKATAESLFGQEAGPGCTVLLEGKEYVVRGLLDSPIPLIVVGLAHSAGMALDRISLSQPAMAEEFAMRHGLSPLIITEADALAEIAEFVAAIPLLAALLLLAAPLWRTARRKRAFPLQSGLWTLLSVAGATGFLLLLLYTLPSSLAPTRWSDFSFWSGFVAGFKSRLLAILSSPGYAPDLLRLWQAAGCLWGVVATLLLKPAANRMERILQLG